MDEAPILMTPRSSMVEQMPYKRPIWVQLPAGQPTNTHGGQKLSDFKLHFPVFFY